MATKPTNKTRASKTNNTTKKVAKNSKAAASKSSVKKIPLRNRFSNLNLKNFLLPVSIILVILLLGFFRNQFVAAAVNGEQISRIELFKELEKTDGQRVLQNLITQKLITQEAEKRNITVSDEEIDKEISKIEESVSQQGQNLDNLLAIQNFTREQLKEQLKNQVLLQKMVNADEITVSDEEVNKYIEDNQELLQEGTNPDEVKESLKEQLKQQEVNTQIQNLLSELQQNANIEILLNQ